MSSLPHKRTTEPGKLTMILGPMFSGKSYDLIGYLKPFEIANISFGFYQPKKDDRDAAITSRAGSKLISEKVESIAVALGKNIKVVGIDEIHMFPESDALVVRKLLAQGTTVFVAGLDMDYQGKMQPIVTKLFELGPARVSYKCAVCNECRQPDAIYTQILDKEGRPVLGGLPAVVPQGSELQKKLVSDYVPKCRFCFVRKEPESGS